MHANVVRSLLATWLLSSALVLPAYAAEPARTEHAATTAPRVVVTIKPVHALVAGVMNGVATPELLVDGQASPHTYVLTPSKARVLSNADVLVRVSATVEPFTRRLAETAARSTTVVTLVEAAGMNLLPRRIGATFAAHDHHHDHGVHDHEHDDGQDSDKASAKPAEVAPAPPASQGATPVLAERADGHIWLDPRNAQAIVTELAGVLAAKDPANAATYRANAEALRQRLATLEREIVADLAPVHDRPFVVLHDAMQYFETRFGLHAVGAIMVGPDTAPGARRLSELRHRLSGMTAVCVFGEPMRHERLIAAVVEGSSIRAGTLDPEATLLEPPGPNLYFELMRGLTRAFHACLAAS